METIIFLVMTGILKMVNIKTYVNNKLYDSSVVSSSNAEFFFVKNSISYVNSNFKGNKDVIKSYDEYLKSIAVQKFDFSNDGTVKKVELWIYNTFSNNIEKEVCIECDDEKEWIDLK
jgi:hypothetical protein